jgi:pterin-4a-carbinolamine dehydratase/uncharacterized protein (DUF2267 family)
MSDKQKEGDNQRRRALARQAREQGRRPSQAGVTLGATKQPEHLPQARRAGPAPAGVHKPPPGTTTAAPSPAPAERSWPATASTPDRRPDGDVPIRYRDFVTEVARLTGVDFDRAKISAEATITALARNMADNDRDRLLAALPTELHDDFAVRVDYHPNDLAGFLDQVGRIAHLTPEQARLQAQAVLATLVAHDPTLIGPLGLPPDIQDLTAPPEPGGGLVDPGGHPAALTDEELRAALVRLPDWSGTRQALTRTVSLPEPDLTEVLDRLGRLRQETGRGPEIARPDRQTATLTVRTASVGAVTRLDVDLAHRLDAVIGQR